MRGRKEVGGCFTNRESAFLKDNHKKFRGCSRHGKSLSVFKSHFLSQTFALFPVTKRKEAATHEVSGMHPREPQLSLGEAFVWL